MKNHYLHLVCAAALVGTSFGAKVIPTNATANLVLGQADFVTSTPAPVRSSFSLTRPEGIVIDPITRKVFVGDYGNGRILRFRDYKALTNGAGAEAVFGKTGFNATGSGVSATNIGGPVGLYFDRKGRLWVADYNFHRVLMFEAASYRSDSPTADRVLGQPDFTTGTLGGTAAKMRGPLGVWVDANDHLWVADTENNRVLRFDSVSTKANGVPADAVLGQPNLTTTSPGTTSSKMSFPESVTVSGSGTLFVADNTNSRVLRFANAATLSNGASASAVLGQVDFTSSSTGTSATTMKNPTAALITPNDTLWVSDYNNQRLLRFDKASTKPNAAPANGVVGQPDFATSTPAVTAKGSIHTFCQAFVDPSGNLWIADTEHNRLLRFAPDTTKPVLVVTSNVPKTTTKKTITIKGTANDAFGISKVRYQVNGGNLKTATGTTSWQFKANLKLGNNTIKIFAVDSVGNKSVIKTLKVTRS